MDTTDVERWFGEYLTAFASCGRGETEPATMLKYFGVPLLLSTDDGLRTLSSNEQVVAFVKQQAAGMRAAEYSRSEILDARVAVLNAASALFDGTFSRHRSDGAELGRLTATYLIADGSAGRRISMLAVHGG